MAAGVARGIALLQSAGGQRYAMPSVSWGRVLTDLRGPGWMRGRFEWLVELSPFFVEWAEGHARGAGVVPLAWRWNFERGGRSCRSPKSAAARCGRPPRCQPEHRPPTS